MDGALVHAVVAHFGVPDRSRDPAEVGALKATLSGHVAGLVDHIEKNEEPLRTRCCLIQGLGLVADPQSLPTLRRLLSDKSMLVREAALKSIASFGPAAAGELQAVVANIEVPLVRAEAITATGYLGEAATAYLPRLMPFLTDSDVQVRLAVADCLGRLGNYLSTEVVDQIFALADHQQDWVRATAAVALGAIGTPQVRSRSDVLVNLLREHTVGPAILSPACGAALGLGRLGDQGDVLIKYLASPKAEIRAAVCQGLAEMGAKAKPFEAQLTRCLKDDDSQVRVEAGRSLDRLQLA